jgi:hypothetical protein
VGSNCKKAAGRRVAVGHGGRFDLPWVKPALPHVGCRCTAAPPLNARPYPGRQTGSRPYPGRQRATSNDQHHPLTPNRNSSSELLSVARP